VGSAGVAGSIATLADAGIFFGIANVGCSGCVACVACVDCRGCVGCVGAVGLRGAVGVVGGGRNESGRARAPLGRLAVRRAGRMRRRLGRP
jgi:hypothetical protein